MTEINIHAYDYFNGLDGSVDSFLSDEDITKSGLSTDQISQLKDSAGHITESSIDKWLVDQGDLDASQKVIQEMNQSLVDHQGTGRAYTVGSGQTVATATVNTHFTQEDFQILDKDKNGTIDYHEWRLAGDLKSLSARPAAGQALDSSLFWAISQETGNRWCSAESYWGGPNRACADFSATITQAEWSQWVARESSPASGSGLTAEEYQKALATASSAVNGMRDHITSVMTGDDYSKAKFSELYTSLTQQDFAALDTNNDNFITMQEFKKGMLGISEFQNQVNSFRLEDLYKHIFKSGTPASQPGSPAASFQKGISAAAWTEYVRKQDSPEERTQVLESYKTFINEQADKQIANAQKMRADIVAEQSKYHYDEALYNGWLTQLDQQIANANASKTSKLAALNSFNVNDPGRLAPAQPTAEQARLLSHMNLQALMDTSCAEPWKYTSFTQEDMQFMMMSTSPPSWIEPKYRETFETLKWKIFSRRTATPDNYGMPGYKELTAADCSPNLGDPEHLAEIWNAMYKSRYDFSVGEWNAYIAKQNAA